MSERLYVLIVNCFLSTDLSSRRRSRGAPSIVLAVLGFMTLIIFVHNSNNNNNDIGLARKKSLSHFAYPFSIFYRRINNQQVRNLASIFDPSRL